VLASTHVPLLPLWLVLCVVGMIFLPWFAVILANDRPPKPQYRLSNRLHGRRTDEAQANAIAPAQEPTVIDADGWSPNGFHPSGDGHRASDSAPRDR
jgi:hypothetical protein